MLQVRIQHTYFTIGSCFWFLFECKDTKKNENNKLNLLNSKKNCNFAEQNNLFCVGIEEPLGLLQQERFFYLCSMKSQKKINNILKIVACAVLVALLLFSRVFR